MMSIKFRFKLIAVAPPNPSKYVVFQLQSRPEAPGGTPEDISFKWINFHILVCFFCVYAYDSKQDVSTVEEQPISDDKGTMEKSGWGKQLFKTGLISLVFTFHRCSK